MNKTILSLFFLAMLPATTVAQPKLCGNVVNASGWTGNRYTDPYGIYSFDAADPSLNLSTVATSREMTGNGGGVADDQYVFLYDVEIEDDYASGTIYKFEQGEYECTTYGHVGSLFSVPMAMTWDASNRSFYGCFYNYYGDGYEFGKLDLSRGNAPRTKISILSERMVAMADNDNGTLYAIGKSGALYLIGEEDGKLSKVGNTGLSLSDRIQSACYVDGTIYYAAQTADNRSSLYRIDPQTATATLMGDFAGGEQFSCLYPFKAAAEDGAPAKIEGMSSNFEGPSLTGTVSFTLPDKTFAGGELTGEMTWTLTSDGNEVATGKGKPGESVTKELTLNAGYNSFELYTSNDVGRSPVFKTSVFVGPDTPVSVAWGESKLSVDADGVATVTWPAVTSGINGGYFVPEEVTYRLVRMPGEVKVANALAATTFSEQLPKTSGLVAYYYEIYPQFMGNEGYSAETNKVIVGSGYEVPFTENFDDGALDYWTVLDLNGDYTEWWLNDGKAYSQAGYDGGSDDWLISPAIHLTPGKYYKVAFKYWGGMPDYPDEYKGSTFEVGFGKGTNPDSYQILGKKDNIVLSEDNAKVFSAVVKVDEEGRYNFGIHDISPADAYLLYVDSFTVAEGGTLQVPAPIADFQAVADANGELRVELSFTSPTQTAEGKPLDALTKIDIKRDGNDLVKTFMSPRTGEKMSFTDTEATGLTDGAHTYTITSTNDKGESLETEASVKVGIVAPNAPTDLVGHEESDGIHLTWKAPEKDVQGSSIDPASLTYTITAVKYYTQEYTVIADGVQGTEFTDSKTFDLNGDEQYQVYYEVQATNRAGLSEEAISNQMIVGKPYDLPMVEGFSPDNGDRGSKYLWWIDITEDINTVSFFRFMTGISSDGDDGCAVFLGGMEGAFSNLRSGKICMQDAQKPQMSYDFYCEGVNYADLAVEYSTDLITWTQLDNIDLSEYDGDEGKWFTHTLDLTSCAQYPYVYLRLHGIVNDDYSSITVDNISISNTTSVGRIDFNATHPTDIYSIDGKLVRSNTALTRGLSPGVYLVGGKKIVVR